MAAPSTGTRRPIRLLDRRVLEHPGGRRLYVYGELRGQLPTDGARSEPPPQLHRRLDPLTGTWVAVSPARNARPQTPPRPGSADAPDGAVDTPDEGPSCPLCPGGPELPFSYEAAVFENRFPSLMAHPPAPPAAEDALIAPTAPSSGRCEVVLYTEQHVGSLATLAPAQVAEVVAVWTDRSNDLWAQADVADVLIFENRGEGVGATLSHPHGQIYAFDHLPPQIALRARRHREHRARHDDCLGCRVVAADDGAAERQVAANDSFTVAVPFAPRWPYEVHVRARRHGAGRLGDLTGDEQRDLAAALRDLVLRYDRLFDHDLPYMMVAHEAPHEQPDWHLSFEFFPPHRGPDKLKVRASVETATGLFINDTLPETTAAGLRETHPPHTDWREVVVPSVRQVD
ncbi:galactose-1-phosphate uridylyltransferase [Egicoccus halophilus]|uniref:Galactose-1-phosphate uridylyltransferase n=1 Tax=Egicoccus halophilus TaxID=1670830 RepID=A0A8J3ETA3_9ACTN|nr:galactose-1-phosphate uridylyltransferase [Egicoccus halophilus]GGI03526.1 galactose-1-phosphate uridylyltransferase [Egicoccus halophilus]